MEAQLELPPGYYIQYGGAFENLQQAQQRLQIVVPIALALIFILLYFALNSVSQAVMICVAVPLAAIGGVFALALRGMPFSISAGVGFIVLFGVAVLNGLVLITRFNSLKKEEDVMDLKKRIFTGTEERLRPILLTATAAIMGFLPMALSTSAGAEVQRPLATVVIGGLITATLLTLIVIPVLYYLIESKSEQRKRRKIKPAVSILLFFISFSSLTLLPNETKAQKKVDSSVISTLKEAEQVALQNNQAIKASELGIKRRQQLQKTGFNLPKTNIYY